MKRFLYAALAVLLLIQAFVTVHAYTTNLLSPALTVLSQNETMIKSALVAKDIEFTELDFKRAVGCSVDSITITALPPSSAGTLTFDGAPVSVNQVIKSSGIHKLKFSPSSVSCAETSFRFKASGEYSIACVLKFTDRVNLAPVITSDSEIIEVWTQKDISTYGTLRASDPENDSLIYEIVKYPEKGLLNITNKNNGDYVYTPCDGVTGEDSFTYVVRDEWGNYSSESTVFIDIDKAVCELVFADMEDHWAYNAALVMAADNAMEIESSGGKLYFNPDEKINREDFLVTVMKALGAGEIEPSATVFFDNDKISKEASGYVARAYDLGIIKGNSDNGTLCFNPLDTITRAEAAVILNAIVGADEPDVLPVFADNDSVPVWARSSIYALTEAGIFKGTGSGYISPNEVLSKAETAQILMNIKKLFD